MTREEIGEKLKDIMRLANPNSHLDLDAVGEDTNINTDLGMNSVDMLFIVISIEEFFNINFDNVKFGDLITVGDVINFIQERI